MDFFSDVARRCRRGCSGSFTLNKSKQLSICFFLFSNDCRTCKGKTKGICPNRKVEKLWVDEIEGRRIPKYLELVI